MTRPVPGRERNPAMGWYPTPTPVLGEHEKALDRLDPLLKGPYFLSPNWLAKDQDFALLKGSPSSRSC